MSWIYGDWSQDDSLNSSFPYPTTAGVANAFDSSTVKSVWTSNTQNYGFPYISAIGEIPIFNCLKIKSIWNLKITANYGFPFIRTATCIDNTEEPQKSKLYFSFSVVSKKYFKFSSSSQNFHFRVNRRET